MGREQGRGQHVAAPTAGETGHRAARAHR
jgi:hypothetical protein